MVAPTSSTREWTDSTPQTAPQGSTANVSPKRMYAKVAGVGSALPAREMTNAELSELVDTNDEWIVTRTGIQARRISNLKNPAETCVGLAEQAARQALMSAEVSADELDLIVVGTTSPDSLMPCTANGIQGRLEAKNAFSFDLQAACSGYLYALNVAEAYIRAGMAKNALVVASEVLSRYLDWNDRSTCVLFGDAAGAAVLTATESNEHALLSTQLGSDGEYGHILTMGDPNREPDDPIRICMPHGKEVFKLAVRHIVDSCRSILDEQNLTVDDVDYFLFHQANQRILDMCSKALGVDPEKTWNNLQRYGNTSAATLAVCLDEATRAGKIRRGDLVLMSTFGGGVTWGSALLRY